MAYNFQDQVEREYKGFNAREASHDRNIFSAVTRVVDVVDKTKAFLFSGKDCQNMDKSMGDRYFTPAGVCDQQSSVDECKGKDRYLFIDNIPQSTYPCVDPSQPYDQKCTQQGNNGLIPGVLQDIMSVNPFEFLYSAAGKGSIVNDRCVLRTEEVGYRNLDGTAMFHKETKCSPERRSLICNIETFRNHSTLPPPPPPLFYLTISFFILLCIIFLFGSCNR